MLDEADDLEVCAVCGAAVQTGDIEDTNGWRWFNNGMGGLSPLCPDCPVPAELSVDRNAPTEVSLSAN
jgi:hypothetical protein